MSLYRKQRSIDGMNDVYLTATGTYLPGEPQTVEPDGPLARRVLAANGIRTRHYAAPGELNEQLAAEAVERALKHRGIGLHEVGMLATGTTLPDLRVPGFASMVHGRLGGPSMEILSAGGVCASSMTALAAAERALRTGAHERAVVVGSELAGRHLPGGRRLDEEFLRWTLSDGAGAVVLENRPRPDGISLRLDWTHVVSYANEFPACMYESEGRLRQDVSLLPKVFERGIKTFERLVRPDRIDHLLCHYSSAHFRDGLVTALGIDDAKMFSNLETRGNTGAASIFVMLDDAWRLFEPGQRIVLAVPESGRFMFGLAHLTVVEPASPFTELAKVWTDFEERLQQVPIVRRIEAGEATLDDYRQLLVHLRQQVIEGGRWIARAASNLSDFTLRSAAIMHAAEEHRDFQLLERDYVAVGGALSEIQSAPKNLGSEALSAFMFERASRPDPIDLLGAMFIIEGLGTRKALHWAGLIQRQLGLGDDQVSFLRYHGVADDGHFAKLAGLLDTLTPAQLRDVVRTARVVARLYAMQLSDVSDPR